ncbi:MAG TPA: sulfatase-like hydrolase/transferase, partial [Planctomycetota bacterium]|nr:sulfatase-like hydrolase/transferase [Planctomycetota bacterium]
KLRREDKVYVVLPGTLILLGLLRRHHDTLGGLLAVVVVLLLFLLALPMLLPAQRLPIRSRRVALFVGAAVGALAVLVVGFRTHHRAPSAARAADATAFARLAQPILLAAGDPDRDGASAWLGGRDCSPFDPAISPNAIDVPKNGIDEDCDGADATGVLSVDRPKQLYSGLGRTPGSVKNVVLVVIDAVRMDHTSLVPGYEHRSTPNLEDLAEASFLYTNALSQSSATLFSMPSMLMGRNPDQALWTYEARHTSVTDQKSLPELLRPFGFHSAIVVNSYIIDNYSGVARGFDEVLDAWKGRTARGASGSAITLGIEYIERRLRDPEGSPFLLTLYFDDPHAPYIPHKAFPYGNEQKDLHIGEVAHSDAMFAFFIEYLKNRAALWDDTMLIVTSDHGEEFGEHGGRFHATNCHIESVHV